MNKKLLRSLMALHGDTNKSLAEYLGISEQSVCNKINEKNTEFTREEINAIKRRYSMSADLVDLVFFAEEVSELDTAENE
jgi:antitoxin component HigA of HigAB toxin-antitoxin module